MARTMARALSAVRSPVALAPRSRDFVNTLPAPLPRFRRNLEQSLVSHAYPYSSDRVYTLALSLSLSASTDGQTNRPCAPAPVGISILHRLGSPVEIARFTATGVQARTRIAAV